jgi:hypothetical protein
MVRMSSSDPAALRAAMEARDHDAVVVARAAVMRMASAPLTFFMRRTAASGPSLLRLNSRRS